MNQKRVILKGAFILTAAGFASRIMGFFYRIFLSRAIGAEGLGLYQLIFPVYTMALSLTASGIHTSVSRHVSARMALGDRRGARDVFKAGLLLTLGGTLAVAAFLYLRCDWIAAVLLKETRCAPLIRLLAYALPFSGIHSCIGGYYLGLKKTHVPALSQLIEQIARVSSSVLIYRILLEKGIAPTPVLAVLGLLCEEMVSALFCLSAAAIHFGKEKLPHAPGHLSAAARGLLGLSLPLTANRVLIGLLSSVEAICIPLRLGLFGLSSSSALSVYGELTGMAMPLILFPSAVTNAISVMLLPTVSEAQASGSGRQIVRTVESTIRYSLILGILCTGIFLCFGKEMGIVLFGSDSASGFILILAWLCPFLYLSSCLTSIQNGLGMGMATFWQSILSLGLRILFVWFAIPRFGISGYLWGLLASQLLSAAMALAVLHRRAPFSFDSAGWILRPSLTLAVSVGVMLFFRSLPAFFHWKIFPAAELLLSAALLSALYLGSMFFSEIYILLRRRGILRRHE